MGPRCPGQVAGGSRCLDPTREGRGLGRLRSSAEVPPPGDAPRSSPGAGWARWGHYLRLPCQEEGAPARGLGTLEAEGPPVQEPTPRGAGVGGPRECAREWGFLLHSWAVEAWDINTYTHKLCM